VLGSVLVTYKSQLFLGVTSGTQIAF